MFKIVTILISALLLSACSGHSNVDKYKPEVFTEGDITGQILDFETGLGLPGLTVTADGLTATTGLDGSYTIEDVPVTDRILVEVSGEGYTSNVAVARVTGTEFQNQVSASLLPVGLTENFGADSDFTTSALDSLAQAAFTANSLVKSDGSAPDGEVTINLTAIDPTQNIKLLPGELLVGAAGSGQRPMESFGALTTTLIDSAGNPINLADGESASIRIPLADKSGSPPATTSLFFYDEATGLWVEEGTATLTTTADGGYYEGTVSHFSTWNAGLTYDPIYVNGCVEDFLGRPVNDVYISADGVNYSGISRAYSEANGTFSIAAKPNATVIITAEHGATITNSIKQDTLLENVNLSQCLVVVGGLSSGLAVAIKLTWDEAPSDLDSHLLGANSHVYYISKGSLTAPPYAQLDVDDTTSYGPEVITILKFPEPGTYQYLVHNFSQSFSPGITDSPTRVVLNVAGTISTYVPPPGEGDNLYWNVFEFVVAADGTFTVNTVNTWLPTLPDIN